MSVFNVWLYFVSDLPNVSNSDFDYYWSAGDIPHT